MADVHAGNHKRFGGETAGGLNARCRLIVRALANAAHLAAKEGCQALLVLGDLYDTVRPEPQVIAAVQQALRAGPEQVYVMLGNHDQVSTADGDHALGPLAPVASVVAQPTLYGGNTGHRASFFIVPFRPGRAEEWLPQVMAEWFGGDQPKARVQDAALLLHLGLSDADTEAYLRGSADSVPATLVSALCDKYGFIAAFAGNWHFHRLLNAPKPFIAQVGTLAPTGFDNAGLHGVGSMMVWDTDTQKARYHRIPGPRFVKVRYGEPHGLDSEDAAGCSVFVSVTASAADTPAALAALDEWRKAGLVVDGEVVPDKAEVAAGARAAASAASAAAESLGSALAGFVKAMPLDEGVDRTAVLETARRYLGVNQ